MIKLRRSEVSEAKRFSVLPYCPTWASCSRLILIYNADPGRQGQRQIRHRHGWAWTCGRCRRELEGSEGLRPDRCTWCKAPGNQLVGHETLVYYLAEMRHDMGGYRGGLDLVDSLIEIDRWIAYVAPDHAVYVAASYWLQAESLTQAGYAAQRSHGWIKAAQALIMCEWDRVCRKGTERPCGNCCDWASQAGQTRSLFISER